MKVRARTRRHPAGREQELAAGRVRLVVLAGTGVDQPLREALVVRDSHGQPRAYLNTCKHLPIPLDGGTGDYLSEEGRYLLCSTHGARYRLEDGYCVDGPCEGESLDSLAVEVEGGQLYVLEPDATACD
ncbi:MAG: Rieske (2Fe-2S) protein [Proteobacteria bacterium]|nr:Rieske (2Fe-2S) protein [Pseudomonadota bacterium]